MANRNLKTVPAFLAERTEFTPGQVRWWIFDAANNGLGDHNAVVRIGRRVWLDVDGFDRWIDSQQRAYRAGDRHPSADERRVA